MIPISELITVLLLPVLYIFHRTPPVNSGPIGQFGWCLGKSKEVTAKKMSNERPLWTSELLSAVFRVTIQYLFPF